MDPSSPEKAELPEAEAKEQARLDLLRRYAVLDTDPESDLDKLAALAAQICETPIALISLVDSHRQWFKSRIGLKTTETPRSQSFCAHALEQTGLLIVPDALKDERFARNPQVTGDPGIRFYAGAPLLTPEGSALGTLCVIDRIPRVLNDNQQWSLKVLSEEVMKRLQPGRRRTDLGLDASGQLPAGIHDLTLEQLASLVCLNPQRGILWFRLMSFLAWPILTQQFPFAFISGTFLSDQPQPKTIDVTLQTREPYGPLGLAPLHKFLAIGQPRILEMHSIHLRFWMENVPVEPFDNSSFFQRDHPAVPNEAEPAAVARINLCDPAILTQFRQSVFPFAGLHES